MCKAAERNPTDIPEDINADQIGNEGEEEEEMESEAEENDFGVFRLIALELDNGGSDCDMESDPDYEEGEESDYEDEDSDELNEEEEEEVAREALAKFYQWKTEWAAARLAARQAANDGDLVKGDQEEAEAEPKE